MLSNKTNFFAVLISLSFILLPVSYLYAQNGAVMRNELRNISRAMNNAGIITLNATKYIGTPYFNKWQQGYVIIKGNKKSRPVMLRYNMWKNNVQFIKNKKIYIIPAKKMLGFVLKTNHGKLIFKNGFQTDKDDINQNTLLQVIYNGNVKLLAQHTSSLLRNISTYGTAVTKNKFDNDTHYYLQTSDKTFHKVKLNKDDILKALPNSNKKIVDYANNNNLSFDNKADLKKILSHYDRIGPNS